MTNWQPLFFSRRKSCAESPRLCTRLWWKVGVTLDRICFSRASIECSFWVNCWRTSRIPNPDIDVDSVYDASSDCTGCIFCRSPLVSETSDPPTWVARNEEFCFRLKYHARVIFRIQIDSKWQLCPQLLYLDMCKRGVNEHNMDLKEKKTLLWPLQVMR